MGPATTLASGRLSRRSPVGDADEAHRAAIGREKAEKPSIAIDNKRAVLSWPRRLKIRTAVPTSVPTVSTHWTLLGGRGPGPGNRFTPWPTSTRRAEASAEPSAAIHPGPLARPKP